METAEKKIIKSKMLDDQGNSIITIRNDNMIKILLRLKLEKRNREIGFVNTKTNTLYITRKRGEHLFRKYNAYGFCYQIIKDAKKFDKIRLKDEYFEWLIPTEFILNKENVKFFHFKGIGFELQVFLHLDLIEQFKRPSQF